LVAADVERADDEPAPAAERGRDRAVDLGLLALVGRGIAVQEQQLRAQQSHRLPAMGDGGDGFLGRADVGGNLYAMSVGRRGRLARRRPLTLALRGEPPHHGPRRANLALVRTLAPTAAPPAD